MTLFSHQGIWANVMQPNVAKTALHRVLERTDGGHSVTVLANPNPRPRPWLTTFVYCPRRSSARSWPTVRYTCKKSAKSRAVQKVGRVETNGKPERWTDTPEFITLARSCAFTAYPRRPIQYSTLVVFNKSYGHCHFVTYFTSPETVNRPQRNCNWQFTTVYWWRNDFNSDVTGGVYIRGSRASIILLGRSKVIFVARSVCISGYPLSGYPDLSVNFMAAKNPDILKWKSGCCGCLQNLCKLCLWYCGGTSNYSKSNRHSSKEWMVTLVSQTRSTV